MKLFLVAGARPNFIKIAPLVHQLKCVQNSKLVSQKVLWKIIHTGQHYDYEMSKVFFDELDIPKPDYFLNAGSGSHAKQIAKIMLEFEKVCLKEKPDIVVVVGDVNSTLACSITAKKLNIKVAHVEAGLRSFDMTMPEEINRMVTDSISDYLFVSEESGITNLKKEGKVQSKVFFVGNVMIDTLFYGLKKLKRKQTFKSERLNYAVVTLHRPSNVDEKEKLKDILLALREIAKDMDVYFPMHPRTKKNIEKFKLQPLLQGRGINIGPPMSYLEFLNLWKDASLVLTDSGGIQEETTVLGIPCFTIRENTERPITVQEGTNILVGTTGKGILRAYKRFKKGRIKKRKIPKFWDGKSAKRIITKLLS
ncbi:MAG: UDP-N-acetylglucosamine 2-epimerase (non-hydrolyzing) [Nitrospirae bacterium]|nr:UDP-N-acetylglucosamine 2-epimerase (non-hydrolyzing) [Nitrospirota bacterium]